MSRIGEDARARTRRHRAAVALRSQTSRASVDGPEIVVAGSCDLDVQPGPTSAPIPPAAPRPAPVRFAAPR
jgi:hypothetical protein